MVEPRRVVDALREHRERLEVVGDEVERAVGPPEAERPFGRQPPGGVFLHVPPVRGLAARDPKAADAGPPAVAERDVERLARFELAARHLLRLEQRNDPRDGGRGRREDVADDLDDVGRDAVRLVRDEAHPAPFEVEASSAGLPPGGKTWCASSTITQCGAPVSVRSRWTAWRKRAVARIFSSRSSCERSITTEVERWRRRLSTSFARASSVPGSLVRTTMPSCSSSER
jgi:hypothetical protein